MNNRVSLEAFYENDRGVNDTQVLCRAMKYCRDNSGTTLTIPSGVYTITGERAKNAQNAVLQGLWGACPQDIMFSPHYKYDVGIDFDGQNGTTIIAHGVTLMVDGFMEPVSIKNCKDITIEGLSIDHVRKPYSRAIVEEVSSISNNQVTIKLRFDPKTPIFPPQDGETPIPGTNLLLRYIFWDAKTQTSHIPKLEVEKIIDSTTAICRAEAMVCLGMEFYCIHTFHARPGILIENADNTLLKEVTIHSQAGMGIVGHKSTNIDIQKLRIVPSDGHRWSTNTDATHFSSIRGILRFHECEFMCQGDDATNVHGYFHGVVERLADGSVIVKEKTPAGTHTQSSDCPMVGDTMELTNLKSLLIVDSFKVVEAEPLADIRTVRLKTDRPLPEDLTDLALINVSALPYVEFTNCVSRSHFARGILLKIRSGHVSGNVFSDIQGPAIEAAGEAWWGEGPCPANIVIENNIIENCGTVFGDGTGILVKADAPNPEGQSITNITIRNNKIISSKAKPNIFCRNISGLDISGNGPACVESCTNVQLTE